MPEALDRVKSSLGRLVDWRTRKLDFLALYPCKVVAQNGDGSLELQPDDARLPSLSKVPMRLGIPGATATVQAGARVLLTWAGGDPRLPVALAWEASGLQVLSLGPGPLDFVALAAKVKSALDDICGKFDGHTHTCAAPGAPTGTPAAAANPTVMSGGAVATGVAASSLKVT